MPEIQMPKLSDTMTEGTLVAWKKKKGDTVSTGDVIAEIETDKATMEWESPEDGVLTEIYVEEGGKVEIGQRIAFIGEEGEGAPAEKKDEPKAEKKEEARRPKRKQKSQGRGKAGSRRRRKRSPPTNPPSRARSRRKAATMRRVKASPLARRLAAEQGLDISEIKGSGPEGRVIVEADVRAAMKSKPATAARQKQRRRRPRPRR